MAEDSDLERTEPASPRRIEQAREKGQVARSRELTTFAVLLAAGAGLMSMGGGLIEKMASMMRHGFTLTRADAFNSLAMLERLQRESLEVLLAFLPFLLLLVVATVASSMLLSGWLFTFQAVQPDFGRLNPAKGFGRIFSWQAVVELAKAIAKSALIGGVAAWVIWHNVDTLLGLAGEPLGTSLAHLGRLAGHTFLVVVASMVLIVAIDVPFQLWTYAKQLRMTKEEVRQETKESEGDPQIKARIRSLQREAARKRMMAEIPKADVIVTNPTHYAVALRYQDSEMRAPRVVAKGSHLLAERIRALGEENGVPILQAPPLARALYRHADLGDEIPSALYTAVAEVLAYVYQLRNYRTHGGAQPKMPEELAVPPELDPGEKPE